MPVGLLLKALACSHYASSLRQPDWAVTAQPCNLTINGLADHFGVMPMQAVRPTAVFYHGAPWKLRWKPLKAAQKVFEHLQRRTDCNSNPLPDFVAIARSCTIRSLIPTFIIPPDKVVRMIMVRSVDEPAIQQIPLWDQVVIRPPTAIPLLFTEPGGSGDTMPTNHSARMLACSPRGTGRAPRHKSIDDSDEWCPPVATGVCRHAF